MRVMTEGILLGWNIIVKDIDRAYRRTRRGEPGPGIWDIGLSSVISSRVEELRSFLSQDECTIISRAAAWAIEDLRNKCSERVVTG